MPNEDTFNPEEFKQFVVRNKSAAKTAYTVKKSLSYTEQLYERDRVIGEEMRTSPNPIVRGLTKATDYILPQALSQKDYGKDEYNIYGDIGARIPGAGRALIQNKNPIQGFKKPSTIPTMGEYLYLKQDIPLTGNTMQDALRAYPTAFVGEAIDMALNPFTWVGGSVANNKTLATGAQKVGKLISENPITKTTAQLLPRMANNALGITRNTGKNLNVAERGLRNVRLTFGSPMRQFRKFQAKMVYTEDDLRNLPLKQQVVRQAEKATIKYRGEGGQLSSQIGAKAEDIAQAKSKGEAYRDLGQIIKQNIAAKRQGITAKHQSDTLLQKINNREAKLVITDNINMLDDELTKVAHQGAEDIQPLLKQFFKGNSEAYGDRLNKYSDLLEKSGKPLTIGEANGIADNILKELDEMEILGGNGRAMVQNLKAKYSLTNVEGVVIRDANDTVNFIEFNKGMRDIIHTTSATFKSGARVTENDLVQVMVHKHWGNYIAQNVEDFSDMQGAYRPVIEAMKTTGKVFKPYASGFQNTGGAAFLRKVATGASTPQETRALKLVEEGGGFAPGIGEASASAKRIGSQLLSKKEALKQTARLQAKNVDDAVANFQNKINALDAGEMDLNRLLAHRSFELSNEIDELERGKVTVEKLLSLNKVRAELRQTKLAERSLRIQKLIHIKRIAAIVKLSMGAIATSPIGIPQLIGRQATRAVVSEELPH